jgi:hypothetical protein
MKFKLILLLLFSSILLATSSAVRAAANPQVEVSALAPLCLPGEGQQPNDNCQTIGPIGYFTALEQQGVILPLEPLPAFYIDQAYTELPFNYVRLSEDPVPIFSGLDDATRNNNPYRYIPEGFKFASYIEYSTGNGNGKYYMIEPGMWIRGGSTSGRVASTSYVGMQFAGTPSRKFGWVIKASESYNEPGSTAAISGRALNKFDPIQVYQTREVNGVNWYLIAPEEWVEASNTALVYPAIQPPEGVANGRWIEINLYEQTVAVYQDNRLIFASLTSTGIAGWWTQPGLFQIFEKHGTTPMSGAFEEDRSDYYYIEDVPWTMYFDQSRALHGAYWHNYFGYERSHGCANLSPGDARWLFYWANVGDYVYVWDPSGQTPTDPSVYTAGGF